VLAVDLTAPGPTARPVRYVGLGGTLPMVVSTLGVLLVGYVAKSLLGLATGG
jgi:hypothetical protein